MIKMSILKYQKNYIYNIKNNLKKLEKSQIRGICYVINGFHQVCILYTFLYFCVNI